MYIETRDKQIRPSTPAWAWIFAIACGAIPVISLGGAIPAVIGIAGASGCLAASRSPKMPTIAKLLVCIGITVVCWALFVLLIGGIALLRSR